MVSSESPVLFTSYGRTCPSVSHVFCLWCRLKLLMDHSCYIQLLLDLIATTLVARQGRAGEFNGWDVSKSVEEEGISEWQRGRRTIGGSAPRFGVEFQVC